MSCSCPCWVPSVTCFLGCLYSQQNEARQQELSSEVTGGLLYLYQLLQEGPLCPQETRHVTSRGWSFLPLVFCYKATILPKDELNSTMLKLQTVKQKQVFHWNSLIFASSLHFCIDFVSSNFILFLNTFSVALVLILICLDWQCL